MTARPLIAAIALVAAPAWAQADADKARIDLAPNLASREAETLGASLHRQTNTDGQLDNAFHEGRYASVNLLYYPAGNILVGGELLYGRNEQFKF